MAVLMNQWFAPTKFVLTFETTSAGKFTSEEIANLVQRDSRGRVVALHLPQKSVVVGNHQVSEDLASMHAFPATRHR